MSREISFFNSHIMDSHTSYSPQHPYKFNGYYYDSRVMRKATFDNPRIREIINLRGLSNILFQGNMSKLSLKLDKLAEYKEKTLSNYYTTSSEKEKIKSGKRYARSLKIASKFKDNVERMFNAPNLEDLIEVALGSRRDIPRKDGLVDWPQLTEEQCQKIASTFKWFTKSGLSLREFHDKMLQERGGKGI